MYGENRDRGGFSPVPVKLGDELEVTIEAVGAKGDGIAKKDGFVLFVAGVQKGDHVRIKITKVLRKVGFAEVVSGAGETDAETSEEESEPEETQPEEEEPTEQEAEPAEPVEDSEDFGEEEKQ